MDYRYLIDEWDRERMRGAIRTCIEITRTAPLSDLVAERVTPTDEDLASDEALDAWMFAT